MSMRRESGRLNIGDLASKMSRLKVVGENLSEEERDSYIHDLYQNSEEDVDFELFLKVSFCHLGLISKR
jgi:plastin-1